MSRKWIEGVRHHCFNCGMNSHYAMQCTNKSKGLQRISGNVLRCASLRRSVMKQEDKARFVKCGKSSNINTPNNRC